MNICCSHSFIRRLISGDLGPEVDSLNIEFRYNALLSYCIVDSQVFILHNYVYLNDGDDNDDV